jgi:hypothetical protein
MRGVEHEDAIELSCRLATRDAPLADFAVQKVEPWQVAQRRPVSGLGPVIGLSCSKAVSRIVGGYGAVGADS